MYCSSKTTGYDKPPVFDVRTALVGTGTNQDTAAYLPAYNNIILSVPAGSGFILNPAATREPVATQNLDASNDGNIYPPKGARINSLAVNAPIVIDANGGRLTFTTDNPLYQWYAG